MAPDDLSRRDFLKASLAAGLAMATGGCTAKGLRGKILTVRGAIEPEELGPTLPHEHVLVDFIEADRFSRDRYDPDEVFRVVLPHLQAIRKQGVTGFVECTPNFMGRDPELLLRLSRATGLHILTNTGLYKEPHLPRYAFEENAEQLARRWIKEIEVGIEGTNVRAGFIKIAMHKEPLKPMQQKIVRAAALTHLATGATIACHSGYGPGFLQLLDILEAEGAPADAAIMVHAQGEKDRDLHYRIAERGAWIEYDNLGSRPIEEHLDLVLDMIERGFADRLLLSMDRGWYHVGEQGGGEFRPYTYLFGTFVPALREVGVGEETIRELTVVNPARAFRLDA